MAAARYVAYGALVDEERSADAPTSPAPTEESGRTVRTRPPGPRAATPTSSGGTGSGTGGSSSPAATSGAGTGAVSGVEAAAEPTRVTRTRPAERRTTELREARAPEPRTGTEYRAGDVPAVEPSVPTNIYRARRPAVAVLLIIPAIGVGLLLIRALAIAAFGDAGFNLGWILASACGLAALPLLVAGLYGLVTGAAHGAEQYGFKVWARPPLAYLLVGLALVAAAAVAIRGTV